MTIKTPIELSHTKKNKEETCTQEASTFHNVSLARPFRNPEKDSRVLISHSLSIESSGFILSRPSSRLVKLRLQHLLNHRSYLYLRGP
ncbi:hypothetical protein CDAR_20631 [Caerostris darwini]|uniref:Uncharacterized protein n=1 Tax=Caerostris darwini TaxID=1538125 RepID=A0AAV4QB91_9ARAC|nr:hypothetical protein CDAR_20631 [Caerostris darwini]